MANRYIFIIIQIFFMCDLFLGDNEFVVLKTSNFASDSSFTSRIVKCQNFVLPKLAILLRATFFSKYLIINAFSFLNDPNLSQSP